MTEDNLDSQYQTSDEEDWIEEDYEEDYDTEDSTPIIEELQNEKDMLKEELRKKEIQKILDKINARFGISYTPEELSEINMTPEELYNTYEMLHRNLWDISYLLEHKKAILNQLDKFIEKNGELKQQQTIKGFGDNLCEWNTATYDLFILNDDLSSFFHALLPRLARAIELAKKGHKVLLEMIKNNVEEYLKLIGEKEGYDRYYTRKGEYYSKRHYPKSYKEYEYEHELKDTSEYERVRQQKLEEAREAIEQNKSLDWLYKPYLYDPNVDKDKTRLETIAEDSVRDELFGKPVDIESEKEGLKDIYQVHNEQVAKYVKDVIEKDKETEQLSKEEREEEILSEEQKQLRKLSKEFIKREGKREY